MELQTLLLTHFNIRFLAGFTCNLDPEWLGPRFEYFEKYCLPSVVSQTSKDFKWVLFFDQETPQIYKDRIERHKANFENMEIVYVQSSSEYDNQEKPRFPDDVSKLDYIKLVSPFMKESDYTLTVRLDNDDAIASTYIENLQRKSREIISTPPPIFNNKNLEFKKYPFMMSAPIGLHYFVKTGALFKIRYPHNHFLAMLAKNDDLHMVYEVRHIDFKFDKVKSKCTLCEDRPMWIEVVSGMNVINHFDFFYFPTPIRRLRENYGFDLRESEKLIRNTLYLIYYFVKSCINEPRILKQIVTASYEKTVKKLHKR